MKLFKYLPLVFGLTFACILLSNPANACTSKGPGAPNGCGGCNTTNIKKDASWFAFYNAVRSKGVSPISCYRSPACQANLVRTCARGRAAKGVSNHTSRIAMDFSTSNGNHKTARSLAPQIIKGRVGALTHGGGGYHMSNSPSEGHTLSYKGKSAVVQKYKEEHVASPAPSGSRCGTGSSYTNRKGFSGSWLQRRSCEWVKMCHTNSVSECYRLLKKK
ncbi:MAG: DUF882 domain-containing protein [Oligoflexia bacterium]|nr:DUF882 domain-containing protein [Oligoflexia bacterium]